MKNLQKLKTKIFGILAITALTLQATFAAPLTAQFFTSSFDVNVGDTIVMELKVVPTADKPAYTVGATLKYDPSLVNFVSSTFDKNWLGLSRSPYELTDTSNGVITRTAGYPEGLRTNGSFAKYTFVAKAPGQARMRITEGMSLDAENTDSGIQNKEITINIRGKEVAEPAPTPDKPAVAKAKPQTIVIDINGNTAFYTNEDYTFDVLHKLTVAQPTVGTTNISVFNTEGAEVYKESKALNTATNTVISFVIPKGTLPEGNYSITAESKYDNQKSPTNVSKDIGSLAQNEKTIDKTIQVPFIPLYMYVIIGILLLILFLMFIYSKSKKFRKFIKNF